MPAETVAEAPSKIEPAKIDAAAVPTPAVRTSVSDAKKDETHPTDPARDAVKDATKDSVKTETMAAIDTAPKRTGQIAVLVSGKDRKLYVRQNFAPLFETPIAIKPSDRPLGTHVFTAQVDKNDTKAVRWTAVSLPSVPHRAEEVDSVSHRRKLTGAVEVESKPLPNSAAEALDRLTIPADVMTQITDALATGGSIVVSDQGITAGGETGQGTEFVVPLR
jgi:hypothetical protein